jgi:hypothetical protein
MSWHALARAADTITNKNDVHRFQGETAMSAKLRRSKTREPLAASFEWGATAGFSFGFVLVVFILNRCNRCMMCSPECFVALCAPVGGVIALSIEIIDRLIRRR